MFQEKQMKTMKEKLRAIQEYLNNYLNGLLKRDWKQTPVEKIMVKNFVQLLGSANLCIQEPQEPKLDK